jgi:hypothetical protein
MLVSNDRVREMNRAGHMERSRKEEAGMLAQWTLDWGIQTEGVIFLECRNSDVSTFSFCLLLEYGMT